MVYKTFIHNERELKYIFSKKVFKKHVFHHDNIEEEYYWDDYDTTYGYKPNTLANCPPSMSPVKPVKPAVKPAVIPITIKSRHQPKIAKQPTI